jgi:N-methylhydantoinase A
VVHKLSSVDIAEIDARFGEMEAEGRAQVNNMGIQVESIRTIRYAEMRYQRQEYTLKVRLPEEPLSRELLKHTFEDQYSRRYGHASRNTEIEVVMLRLVIDGRTKRPTLGVFAGGSADAAVRERNIWFEETGFTMCKIYPRVSLRPGSQVLGPALIEEEASTTVLTPGDVATIDEIGNIFIKLGSRP